MRVYVKVRNLALVIVVLVGIIFVFLFLKQKSQADAEHFKNCPKIKSNRKWVINHKIAQYSSYFIQFPSYFRIESLLILSDYKLEKNQVAESIKCIIRFGDNFDEIYVAKIKQAIHTITQSDEAAHHHTKIICDIVDIQSNRLKNVNVAIVDTDYFETFDNVIFQTPTFIDATQDKLQEVAHCVHMVRNIHHSNFETWLTLQKHLGINRQKFYTIDNSLVSFYFDSSIEIIKYELNFESFCGTCSDVDHTECNKIFSKNFKTDSPQFIWHHERLHTNDCYLSLKYIYEFVTNYDLDELIFPRHHNSSNNFDKCEQNFDCSSAKNETFYNYSVRLFDAQDKYKVASITFEYVYFLRFNDKLEDFFNSINNVLVNDTEHVETESNFITLTIDSNSDESQRKHLKFVYKPKHYDHMRRILKAYKSLKCLFKTETYDRFNRFMYIRVDMKMGKSIFNTKYTETISQHHAISASLSNIKSLPLEIEQGFVGHFRDEPFTYFQTTVFEITSIDFDLDYYLFYLSKFHTSLCKV